MLGEDHPQTLQAQRHLALVLAPQAAARSEAEELIRRAMVSGRTNAAKQPAVLAISLIDQAAFLDQTGRREAAEPVLLEAYGLLAKGTPPSPRLKKVCRELELLYGKLNRPDDARKWSEKRMELGRD